MMVANRPSRAARPHSPGDRRLPESSTVNPSDGNRASTIVARPVADHADRKRARSAYSRKLLGR